MRLTYRPLTLGDDLEGCFQRLGDTFAYSPSIQPKVVGVWRHLLRDHALDAVVFEDYERPPAERIIGVSATVWVSEAFVREVRTHAPLYLRAHVVQRALTECSPILSLAEAQEANRDGGVSVFFLNDPLSNHTLSTAETQCLYEKWREVLLGFRAFRLKELLWECYGEDRYQSAIQRCGQWLRTDWADRWQAQPEIAPSNNQHPYLVGSTAEEVRTLRGTLTASLFAHTPPRYAFTLGQQQLLHHALMGKTDEEIARSLHLSISTVKKRWLALYDSVAEIDPYFFEEAGKDHTRIATHSERKRGLEKRRHLLTYLRQHLEDIHPINASKI